VKLGLASRRGHDLGIEGAVAQACDVRDIAKLEAVVATTVKQFGGLDIVIANAGVGSYRPVLDTSLEEIEEMIDVNVKGLIYTVRACVPYLLQRGGGDIVTVASEAGRRGLPSEAVYVASKIRASRLHTLSGSRVAEQGDSLLEYLSGGRCHRFWDGPWTENSRHAGAGIHDASRRRRRGCVVHTDASANVTHPGNRLPVDDRTVLGLRATRKGRRAYPPKSGERGIACAEALIRSIRRFSGSPVQRGFHRKPAGRGDLNIGYALS
jgi:short chain dehydrogenase